MKPCHVFSSVGGLSASQKKVKLFPKTMYFLRHSLKDCIPMTFWYVVETPTAWIDVDIRAVLPDMTETQVENWLRHSKNLHQVREILQEFCQRVNGSPENFEKFLINWLGNVEECRVFVDQKYHKPK